MSAISVKRVSMARYTAGTILSVVLCAIGLLLAGTRPVEAQGPVQTVAHWDYSLNCVTYIKGSGAIEDLVKQTLPDEWLAGWPPESYYCGAELIRTNCVYFNSYPEGNYGLCNQTGQFFHWRDSRMWFVPGSNTGWGNSATDYTVRTGWKSNGSLIFYEFNSCYQYKTRDRANGGLNHVSIIQDYYNTDATACGLPGHTNNVHTYPIY